MPTPNLANVRPVGQRLPPELFAAAKRFVLEFRDGHTEAIARHIEPELYEVLEWLARQSILDADKRRPPVEIGRAILGYRDNNTSRGVAYGALWAALVRLAAVYSRNDFTGSAFQMTAMEHLGELSDCERDGRDSANEALGPITTGTP